MKKYIYMVFMVALMCACSKPDSAEVCVGKIEVGAVAGCIADCLGGQELLLARVGSGRSYGTD